MHDERPFDPERVEAAQIDPPLGRIDAAARGDTETDGKEDARVHTATQSVRSDRPQRTWPDPIFWMVQIDSGPRSALPDPISKTFAGP